MPIMRKQIESAVDSAESGKPVVFKITTEEPDRIDDVIRLDGWKLDAYAKNPVVLKNHDANQVVARATKMWRDAGALKAEVEFAPTALGKETETLVRGGFLNATSVGFRPTKAMPRKDHDFGVEFLEQELLEFSIVAVPANPDAIVEARSMRDALRKQLGTESPDKPGERPPDLASSPGDSVSQDKPSDEPTADAASIDAASKPPDAAPAGQSEEKTMGDFSLSPEQMKGLFEAVTSISSEVKSLREQIEKPVTNKGAEISGAPALHLSGYRRLDEREKRSNETDPHGGKGLGMARVALAKAYSMKRGCPVVDAADEMGYRETAKAIEAEYAIRKSLGESTFSAGGASVPELFNAEIIELLRAKAIVRALGARVLTISAASVAIPKQTGSASAYFVGEGSAITASDPAFGSVNATPKKMGVEVILSNDLLRDSAANIDQLVRDDIVQVAALKEDLACFEGKGTEYQPKGLIYQAGNNSAATGSADLAKSTADLDTLQGKLEDNNVALDNAVYVGHPRHFRGLRGFVNGVGGYPWREEMKAGTLNGLKFAKSGQLSTTGAASRFFIGDFTQAVIVENLATEIVEDTTYTSGGTTYSASAADMTVLRLWRKFDFIVRQPNAFAYLTTCTWGA